MKVEIHLQPAPTWLANAHRKLDAAVSAAAEGKEVLDEPAAVVV